MVFRIFGVLLLVCSAVLFPEHGFTESKLKKLINSPEYRETFKGKVRLKLPPDVDPESNYIQLFSGKSRDAKIFSALGEEVDGFKIVNAHVKRKEQYIIAERVFQTKIGKANITTTVVLPHPAYLELVKEGLLLDLKNLRPDAGEVVSRGPIVVDGETGELIQTKDGETSFFLTLPKEAWFIATIDKPKYSSYLTRLINALTIGELKRQLNS